MRRIAVLVCGLLLVGCSSGNGVDKPVQQTVTEEVAEAAAPENKHAALIDAYTTVLSNPGAYEFNKTDRFEPTGTYSYAIAEVTGDDQPDLLLKADARDYWAPVTVFSKPKDSELFNTREVLIWGAGSAGGGRANIATSPLGNGLFQITGQSIEREWNAELFVVNGQQLVPGNGKATVPATNLYSGGYREVKWTPSSDLGPLHQLGASKPEVPKGEATTPIVSTCGESADTAVFTGTDATSCEFARAIATAAAGKTGSFEVTATSPVTNQNYTMNCSGTDAETVCTGGNNASVVLRPAGAVELNTVYEQSFEGTVMLKRALEVVSSAGLPSGEGPDNEYFMLMLDSPQPVTAIKPGPSRPVTNTVDSIGLAKKEFTPYGVIDNTAPWRLYEDKRIRLHINTTSMGYQTDASLPWGKPRVGSFQADYLVEVLD